MLNRKAVIEILDDSTYKQLLDDKLGEELREYLSNDSVEELADLIEVIYAILNYRGVSLEDFESMRSEKAAERGAFQERILLKEVSE